MTTATPIDHGEPCVALSQLLKGTFRALEHRQFDDALAMVDEAEQQLKALKFAAWQAKRRALG